MSVGAHSYGELHVTRFAGALSTAKVEVGKFCCIAPGVKVLLGAEHHPEWVSTYPFKSFAAWGGTEAGAAEMAGGGDSIVIGNDVWIGYEALLLGGTRVGDGAVISARTVVSGEVAPYSVVAGHPMRFVRWRFPEMIREMLLTIRWWDWEDERIKRAIPYLLQDDYGKFIAAVNEGRV